MKQRQKAGKPKQAMIIMPQWNADAISHNVFGSMFNRFGISLPAVVEALPRHASTCRARAGRTMR